MPPSSRPAASARRRGAFLAWTLAVVGAGAPFAEAQSTDAPCPPPDTPYVVVRWPGSAFDEAFEARVVEDLRAGLAPRGIAVCRADHAPADLPPLAEVRVAPGTDATVGVVVDVSDAVTRKRVGRDVDVADLPEGGRAFAVALAVDELLRASWAELALRPDEGAPGAVRSLVDEGVTEARAGDPATDVIGAAFAFERYTNGAILLGGEAFFRHYAAERLGVEVAFGYRVADEASSDRGTVDTRAFALAVRLAVPLLERKPRRFELELVAGVDGRVVTFTGRPGEGALGGQDTGLALFGRAGLRGAVLLGPYLRLELAAGLGVPFVAQNAVDDRSVVTGLADLETWASFALAFGL